MRWLSGRVQPRLAAPVASIPNISSIDCSSLDIRYLGLAKAAAFVLCLLIDMRARRELEQNNLAFDAVGCGMGKVA
jgi:hypothetical protein